LPAGGTVRSRKSTSTATEEDEMTREKKSAAVNTWSTLGYPEALFVKLAMQAELDVAGIKLKIDIKAA
jgi:hypothetical protein